MILNDVQGLWAAPDDQLRLMSCIDKPPGDLADDPPFEQLTEEQQTDVIFLRESRLRDAYYHKNWLEHKKSTRENIRESADYTWWTFYGWFRELRGQFWRCLHDLAM